MLGHPPGNVPGGRKGHDMLTHNNVKEIQEEKWRTKSPINGIAAVAVLATVLAACGGGATTTAGDTATTAAADTTTAPEATTTTAAATTTTAEATTTTVDALTRRCQNIQCVEGEVTLDQFEPEITFTTEHGWKVSFAQAGAVILEDLDQPVPFTRAVLILNAEPYEADTVDEWLELNDGVTVEDRQETQVGGLDAVVYDLTYEGTEHIPFLRALPCEPCGGRIVLRSSDYDRVWVIERDAQQPLVVFSQVLRADVPWLEKAQAIVDTVEFG